MRAYQPLLRCLALACAAASAGATDARAARQTIDRELPAVRFAAPPAVDGDLSDTCWRFAATATAFSDAVDGGSAPDETTAYVGYDARCIYVGFRCKDSRPESIVARQTRRESSLSQDDRFFFTINPFGTRRSEDESRFTINPLGTQETSIAGGHAGKQEWEGIWQAAARRTPDGWSGEMAIPWELLNRPASTAPTTVDINFGRYQVRTRRVSYWSNIGRSERRELGGRWMRVDVPPGAHRSPLSVLGYNVSGYDMAAGKTLRSGIDARYALTPRLTAVATLNPDFANVEGDVQSIDFSYAEKLASERRPFFLEGGGYFSAGNEDVNVFASQRIPQFATGLKLFGKPRPASSVGVFSTSTGPRNDMAFRWKEALSSIASVSLTYVGRNEPGVTSGVWQLQQGWHNPRWRYNAGYLRSDDRESGGERYFYSGGYGNGRFDANLRYMQTSPGFKARDGYVPFVDWREWRENLSYGGRWRNGAIRDLDVWTAAYQSTHYDGTYYQRGYYGEVSARLANDLTVDTSYHRDDFEQYRDHLVTLGLQYPASDPYHNYGLSLQAGRRGGAQYLFVAPRGTYRFGDKLTLGLSDQTVRRDGSDELDIVTLNYDLDKQHSVAGRLVRRDARVNWYLSYRRSGYGGLEYFVILGDPNADTFARRLVVKVVSPLL